MNNSIFKIKTHTFYILSILCISAFFSGCKKDSIVKNPPVADFTFANFNLRAPVQVTMSNSSQNATSYSWDFGNGTSSTGENPTALFESGGVFTITLTATNDNGSDKITKTINITKPYSKVGISELIINKYPSTKPDGSNWDGSLQGTFPDVYFKIVNSNDQSSIYSLDPNSRKENLRNVDLPSGWVSTQTGTPFCNLPFVTFDVDLYDYESLSSDEYIGSADFKWSQISTISNPYPTSVSSSSFAGLPSDVSITLKLIWSD